MTGNRRTQQLQDADDAHAPDALMLALASGKSVAEAARLAGCSERSAWRRLEDLNTRRQVRALRAAMVERAVGQLAAAMTQAVAALVESLGADNEAVRVRAAVAILDQAVRLRESEELERRVAELEALLAGQEEGRAAR